MRCDEFEQILEQEQSKPYPDAAAAHLDECDACRGLAAELNAIRMAGHALGEQDAEELEAPDHVWTALRRQLEEEGIIHERAVRDLERAPWWSAFRRPAFAGAALAVVAIAGALLSYQSAIAPQAARLRPVPAANNVSAGSEESNLSAEASKVSDDGLASADMSQQLQSEFDETVAGLRQKDAGLDNSLRRDIELVDSSIALCEKSVREQPGNEIAREYLYGAYQQKAELLDAAMSRSITGGLQ